MKHFILIFALLFVGRVWASNSLSTINSFGPGSSQVNFVSVESAKTLDHKRFSILGFIDTSYKSLAIYNSPQEGNDILSFTHVGLSYGFSPKLELGIKGPVIFNQTSDASQQSIILTAKGFVNIDGFVKYKIFENIKSGLSLMAQIGMANGDEIFYVGPDSGLNYSLSALYERSFGRWLFAANIGYIQRNPGNNDAASLPYFEPIQSTVIGSLGLGRPITKSTRVSGEVLLASHDFVKDNSDRDALAAEALLSFHTKLKSMNLSYGLGAGLTNGVSTPSMRGFVGFQYPFGPSGAVAKKEEMQDDDMEEQVAENAPELPKELPPPVVVVDDDDDDAFADLTEDQMEEVLEVAEESAVVEDAFSDLDDPVVAASPAEDDSAFKDSSSDKPASELLREPAEEKPKAAPAPVVVTELPSKTEENEAEVPENIFHENDDISVREPSAIAGINQKFILNNVEFDFDSARLDKKSLQILENVLNEIKKVSFKTIKVWGHTDFFGPSVYNEYLGLRRAKAVHDYFKNAGIPNLVLDYDGFGERRPLNTGLSDAERRKNRRVEIVVIRD